ESGRRTERSGIPVRRAVGGRADARALIGRLLIRIEDGTAVIGDLARPGQLLHERLSEKQLAVGAIEHVEKSVAPGVEQELARLALPFAIDQRERLLRVPIPDIVRGDLKIPFELAGFGVKGEDRGGVEIIA